GAILKSGRTLKPSLSDSNHAAEVFSFVSVPFVSPEPIAYVDIVFCCMSTCKQIVNNGMQC
ncbi:MAG: hypothetical protein U0M08_01320, partial [Clostridia bacterium]|nr:hypothetical protein [Clostridia bacterium]